ncbi:unnamed protein product [Staurois parvus]|uniref:Uncharacterized protein n=1 Tax=Staurois parvus TaxID=386267 RepID=A0ABN9DS62_9NEOB|nr:unnamed protein product [Staurois parvus]
MGMYRQKQARVVASVHASISGSSASSASSTPEVKPLKTLLGDSAPTLHLNKNTPSQVPQQQHLHHHHHHHHQEKKFDLLSDLGGDIFATPAPQQAATANFANFANFNSHTGTNANANFAQFDNFPKSSSADFGAFNSTGASKTTAVSKPSQPSADKYAALADLDSIFSNQQGGSGLFSSAAVSATSGPVASSATENSVFGIPAAVPAAHAHPTPPVAGTFGAPASTTHLCQLPLHKLLIHSRQMGEQHQESVMGKQRWSFQLLHFTHSTRPDYRQPQRWMSLLLAQPL